MCPCTLHFVMNLMLGLWCLGWFLNIGIGFMKLQFGFFKKLGIPSWFFPSLFIPYVFYYEGYRTTHFSKFDNLEKFEPWKVTRIQLTQIVFCKTFFCIYFIFLKNILPRFGIFRKKISKQWSLILFFALLLSLHIDDIIMMITNWQRK